MKFLYYFLILLLLTYCDEGKMIPSIYKPTYIIYQNNSSHQISLIYLAQNTQNIKTNILLEPKNKLIIETELIVKNYTQTDFELTQNYKTINFTPQMLFSYYDDLKIQFDTIKFSLFKGTYYQVVPEDTNFANPQYYNYKLANNLPFLKQAFENNIDTLGTYYFTDSNYNYAQFIKK